MRRAAPGPQLAVGRLRVDAARAIAKLREYQLADRSAWVLEGIRAAVAAGATAIYLTGDANDVWLAWNGAPLAVADLPRLFDELVSPEAASERHHVRLLAAAVNSALGMTPAYVDVTAIGETAERVRYTPDVLAETIGDLADSPLRRLTTTTVAAPRPQPGMLVHLRRKAGLEMLAYFLGEPPELGLARAACQDLAVPLWIAGKLVDRNAHARDVLRVELGEGLDGWVAVVDPATLDATTHTAVLEVAERGVVLASYPLDLGLPTPRSPIPLRLFVDAPRMPTNASRSQVRREAHPIAAAEARARRLVPELVDRLVASEAPAARAAALWLLAAAIAGPEWLREAARLAPPLNKLADAPLLRDATGAAQPVAATWSGLVYTSRTPLDRELAPWVAGMLWLAPGDAAARLITNVGIDGRATRRQLRWARRQLRAHEKFFDHAPRAPRVEARTLPQLRVPLGVGVAGSCVPQALFEGLAGEVCLFLDAAPSELVVLLQGRELDRVEFASPIMFAAVIDASQLTPDDRYRGVRRDADYTRVETAMRAGVLRMIECLALALSGAELLASCVVGQPIATTEPLARIVRHGLTLAASAGVPIRPPLSAAPIWRDAGGDRWWTTDELAAHAAVGLTVGDVAVAEIPGRLRVIADFIDGELLHRLLPAVQWVRYDRAWRRDAQLMKPPGGALVIEEGDTLAVIAPADEPLVILHHTGVKLDARFYVSRVTPCRIAIDSPAIVPDAGWTRADDDAGFEGRDLSAWETALIRAAARALVGDPVAELIGDEVVELVSPLGRALANALRHSDPDKLLGAELAAWLRSHPLVGVLGEPERVSAAELAKRFPKSIPYVGWTADEVPGFHPVLADQLTAHAVASLAGRNCHDGAIELELHRRAAIRAQRLASHRQQPIRTLALAGESIALEKRGIVGVGTAGLELELRIEGRTFVKLRRDTALPLLAIVEVPVEHLDPLAQSVSADVVDRIVGEVTAVVPALIRAIATARPLALTAATPERTLLAVWLAPSPYIQSEVKRAPVARETRDVLCAAPAFATIQGQRLSLDAAGNPRGVLSTAAWQDTWLGPLDEPPNALDEPVVQLPDGGGELATIVNELHRGAVVDVTADVKRLQAQRRMARGMLPVPTVHAVAPEWKRKLAELGELGRTLGHGEIGLTEEGSSIALLHARGELVREQPLDVLPPILIALEAADPIADASEPGYAEQLRALRLDTPKPSALDAQVQELAIRLVRKVLATTRTLSQPLRRGLRRAVLAGRIDPSELAGIPLFETIIGRWLDWAELAQQLAWFGKVWAITGTTALQPLDVRREVLRLDDAEIEAGNKHGHPIILADDELALDATTRTNQARSPARSLEIVPHLALARLALDGDGTTAPRGMVAVLAPEHAASRELRPHRAMHPFDATRDPCKWPTLALFDDARLEPDRTWSHPRGTAVMKADVDVIRSYSENALASLAPPPAEALVVERLTAASTDGISKARLQLRGALWLMPPHSSAPPTIAIIDGTVPRTYTAEHGIGLGGTVYAWAPDGWRTDEVMAKLCEAVHVRLLRTLAGRRDLDRDAVLTHLAHGLALQRIIALDARAQTFPCFRPKPLDAVDLAALFANPAPIQIVSPDAPGDGRAVIEDGSELARVVIAWLGERARRERIVAPRAAPAPRSELPSIPAPVATKPHRLQPLVDALRARVAELGITGHRWDIEDGATPMFRYDGALRIAGDNKRLQAVAEALLVRSAWASAALDVVVAHAVTVLNVALTEITDAAEHHAIGALLADA